MYVFEIIAICNRPTMLCLCSLSQLRQHLSPRRRTWLTWLMVTVDSYPWKLTPSLSEFRKVKFDRSYMSVSFFCLFLNWWYETFLLCKNVFSRVCRDRMVKIENTCPYTAGCISTISVLMTFGFLCAVHTAMCCVSEDTLFIGNSYFCPLEGERALPSIPK